MLKPIDPKTIDQNVFSLIGEKWMLITAGTAERCNTMTASWGGLGVIWGAPSATCYIRPQRYTKEFVDREEYFTLAFFGEEYRAVLALCGSKSGREVDKVKECGFTVKTARCGAPYFEEAELVLVCRKRFVQPMDPARLPEDVKERWYPQKDYHTLYIGEIVEAYQKYEQRADAQRAAPADGAPAHCAGRKERDAMNHLSQIADKLSQYDLDAMLIVSEPGERYAVGFQGEGYVLVTQEGSQYSTDGRYIEAAQKQVTGAEVVLTSRERSHLALARDFLAARGLKRVGFESAAVSVAQHRRWQESFPKGCELIPAQELLDGLRVSKDEEEIAAMLQAQKITDAAFGEILNYIRPGLTEQEVAARLVYELLRRGARKVSFDPIVAAGANGSMPHAVPGETVIQKGMFVTMDFGCVYDGYCSDMTRTVAVGQPTQEMERVYETVLAAQKAGIAAARAGMPGRELDAAAREVIEEAGYGDYFTHSFGHSLGLEIHESPNASPSETRLLPVGTVISAEPGIYLPGRFGVRIEDVLVLEEGGCRDITQSPKNLIVL